MTATRPRINEPRPAAGYDPLRLCIFTTIAVIAWLVSPPVAVLAFSTLGMRGYVRAYRAGLLRSRCLLGDTRLVLAYLGTAWVVAAAAIGWQVARLVA